MQTTISTSMYTKRKHEQEQQQQDGTATRARLRGTVKAVAKLGVLHTRTRAPPQFAELDVRALWSEFGFAGVVAATHAEYIQTGASKSEGRARLFFPTLCGAAAAAPAAARNRRFPKARSDSWASADPADMELAFTVDIGDGGYRPRASKEDDALKRAMSEVHHRHRDPQRQAARAARSRALSSAISGPEPGMAAVSAS